jgi:pimeloyl-ACP methyl ester carboxylesterase
MWSSQRKRVKGSFLGQLSYRILPMRLVAISRGDGNRPPLLLINGIGANLEVFDPFIAALDKVRGKKIGTFRFDVPGVGGSPPTLFPLRFRGLARLVAQMLDAVGHQEVDVLASRGVEGWLNNSPTSTRSAAAA